MNWKKTDNRFVAFFDILGFKEMVLKNSHSVVLKKLEKLKSHVDKLEGIEWDDDLIDRSKLKIEKDQTKSVTFSDSFIFFSKSDTIEDLFKLMYDSWGIFKKAIDYDIAIKGAISFGKVTVDFDKNLFFGQPIIDAYLLHEDLHLLGIILDHNVENQMKKLDDNVTLQGSTSFTKVKLKFGFSRHTLLSMNTVSSIDDLIPFFEKLYKITSGRPRIYIDNTLDFYSSLRDELIAKEKQLKIEE